MYQNIINDSMYWEGRVNISKVLNKHLHEILNLVPVVILTVLFCDWKILLLSVEFPQNIIPYFILEWKQAKKITLSVFILLT
jgi:hypothetical protein